MNRDDVVESLHREDERRPVSADNQSVPTPHLCRHPISIPNGNLYRHPILSNNESLPRGNLSCDSMSVPIADHESMEEAVYSSHLGSVAISVDDLMDNRMLHQRAYPVALEDNESMEDPFPSDQSGAAWTYTTRYETHHSPYDPPMYENRLVRYQPNVNRDANVQTDHHPEEGYLLRTQRILKNRSLMKTLLRGTCKALMALFVANGLYGDVMYYHSGTNQYQTTISAGNVTAAVSLEDSQRRRLSGTIKASGKTFTERVVDALDLPEKTESNLLYKLLERIDLREAIDRDNLLEQLQDAGVKPRSRRENIVKAAFAERILEVVGLLAARFEGKELLQKLMDIDLQNVIDRETLLQKLESAGVPGSSPVPESSPVPGTSQVPGSRSDPSAQRENIVNVVFAQRILKAIEITKSNELLRHLKNINLQSPIRATDMLEKLKYAGVPEPSARAIIDAMYAKRILNTLGSSEELENEQLLEQLKRIDWQNPAMDRKTLLKELDDAGISESQAQNIADLWLNEPGTMAPHMGLKPVL